MDKRYIAAIAITFTFVNALIIQQARITKLQDYLDIAEMRADVNAETTQELIWDRVNDVHKATQDQLIAQGRIEGLVSYLKGDDKTELVNKLWHEGYEHGLHQTEYMEDYDATQIIANRPTSQSDADYQIHQATSE